MADSRDFMLAIGAKLVDADITKISDQIKSALKDVPALQIREVGMAQLKKDMESGIAVTRSLIDIEKELEKEYSAVEKSVAQFSSQLEKASRAEISAADQAAKANQASAEAINRSWRTTTANVVAEMTTMMNAIERLNAAEAKSNSVRANVNQGGGSFAALNNFTNANSLIPIDHAAETSKINEMLKAQADSMTKINPAAIEQMGGQLIQIDRAAEHATATFERYAPALLKGVEAHRQMNLTLPQGIADVRGFADEFTHMIGQFALWSAGAHLIEGGVGMISKGLTDAIHSEKEQNITGQYYEAQGVNYTPAMSDEVQQKAIDMARVYGQEVIHVQENVGLWAKVTKGEMVPALALTNEAMKLAAVSGMNMEEIFRDTTAVMGQMGEPLSRQADLYNIATGLALRYGGGIQTLGGESDDAVKQMMDGMTRLSSVMVVGLGHGVDTLARIGAEVAVVSHLTNTSGDEVAGHLAAAFAGIEGNGKVIAGLKGIGIEAKNNANLIQEMGAQMDKVVPIIMGAGVRKQDEEDVLTLLRNYKLVTQATNDAKKAMADAAADKSFESMMKTTQQQINEMKAGWEAVGITLGKQFIPMLQNAANIGNNEVIPWLLANKTEVVELTKSLVELGLVFGSFSILKTVIAVGIRALNEFELAVGKTAISQSVASRAMIMDVTAYQRAVLNQLATTGEADEQMIQSVKLFAAQHNVSIDSVILKMIELQETTAKTAGTVVSSEELMANASLELSAKTGIAADAMKAEFAGIAVAGESMSVAIGSAFLKMIPVIGLALTAFEVGKFAIDQLGKAQEESLRDSPRKLAANLAGSSQRQDDDFARMQTDKQTMASLSGDGSRSGRMKYSLAQSDYNQAQSAWQAEDNWQHKFDPAKAPQNPQDLTIAALKRQLAELEARGKQLNSNNFIAPPVPDGNYADGTTGGKGIASPSSQLGLKIDDIKTKYDGYLDILKGAAKLDDQEIAAAEKRISVYGNTAAAVANLIGYLKAKNAVDAESISTLGNERSALQNQLNAAESSVKGKDPSLASTVAVQARIEALKQRIDAIQPLIDAARADMASNRARGGEISDSLGKQQFDSDLSSTRATYSTSKTALSGARTPASAAAASAAFAAETASDISWVDKYIASIQSAKSANGELTLEQQREITELQTFRAELEQANPKLEAYAAQSIKIADATAELRGQLTNTNDAGLATALKSIASLTKEYNDDLVVAKAAGKDTSDIETWKQLSLQIISAKFALDEYDEKKKQVEASPLYIGLTDSIDSIGSSLIKTMENSLNYFKTNLNNIIEESNARISQLNQEDSALRGPQYQGIRQSNMLLIRQQQEAAQAAQYKLANPSILQSIQSDIQKSFLTSITTSLENSAKSGLMNVLTGQSDPAKQSQVQFQNSTAVFAAAVTKFASSPAIMAKGDPANADSANALTVQTQATTATRDNTTATTAATTAATLGTTAVTTNTAAIKTQNSTMSTLTNAISGAISGAGTGSGIAGLFGENTSGGAAGGALAGGFLAALTGGAKTFMAANPLVGLGITAAAGLIGGLFGDHTKPATSPDIYDTATYGAFVGNVNGGGSANGQSFSLDPAIAAQTGGLSEGAYIENFIKGKTPAQLASVFGSEAPSIQQMFGQFTEDGGLTNLHNGNLDISGQTVNWQTINQEATDAFNAITQAANSLNQALAPIISVSAYGKGSNSAVFSPYYTPGYGDTSSLNTIPYPSLFAQSPTTATYNAPPSTASVTINTTTTLDGQVIAQNTSQYRSQQIARGLQADS